ncbi:YggT family protein [Thorsellia anophelis]|uniref:YggT family protein n=1 Tax=Thorsellia anophelis DSM 18579 TaxID=1123402 RepID=A0A1H9YD45_9GAMM|nr:YggT family protein [Thorsellia anophelis]SES66877.1 YggT family protein [Thorsellia anophelis DSM 18579]
MILIYEIINLYVMVLILRVWLQIARADFYNPFSQTIVKLTEHITAQPRRLFPARGAIDYASLLIAYVLIFGKFLINSFVSSVGSFDIVGLIVFSVLDFTHLIGQTVFWVMIINVILSWVSQGRNPIDAVIYQLTQPLIGPIKRIVPPVGMIDFSIMIFLFGLYFLNYLHGQVTFFITRALYGI